MFHSSWNHFNVLFLTINLFSCTFSKEEDLREGIFGDALAVWQSFRDPENGAWCDTLRFNQVPMVTCGENNNFYSSAGTG
jgi:hypothetical protein